MLIPGNRWSYHVQCREDDPPQLLDFLDGLPLDDMSEPIVEQLREAVAHLVDAPYAPLAEWVGQLLGIAPIAATVAAPPRGFVLQIVGAERWAHPGSQEEVLDDLRAGRVPTDAWPYGVTAARRGRGTLIGTEGSAVDGTLEPRPNGFRASFAGETVEVHFGPPPCRTAVWRDGVQIATWWHPRALSDDRWTGCDVPCVWDERHPDVGDGALWPPEPADDHLRVTHDRVVWQRPDGTEHPLVLPAFEDDLHRAAFSGDVEAFAKRTTHTDRGRRLTDVERRMRVTLEGDRFSLSSVPPERIRQWRIPEGVQVHLSHPVGPLSASLRALRDIGAVVHTISARRADPEAWVMLVTMRLKSLWLDEAPTTRPEGWADAAWQSVSLGSGAGAWAFPPPAGCESLTGAKLGAKRGERGWQLTAPTWARPKESLDILHEAAHLESLALPAPCRPDLLLRFIDTTATVERLVARRALITDGCVPALVRWRARGVETLDITDNHLTAAGLEQLASAGFTLVGAHRQEVHSDAVPYDPSHDCGTVHLWYRLGIEILDARLHEEGWRTDEVSNAIKAMRRLRTWNPVRGNHAERVGHLHDALPAEAQEVMGPTLAAFRSALWQCGANWKLYHLDRVPGDRDSVFYQVRSEAYRDGEQCGLDLSGAVLTVLPQAERPQWVERFIDATRCGYASVPPEAGGRRSR